MTKLFQEIESVDVTVNHKGFQFQYSYDNATGIYNMVVLDAGQYVGNVFVTLAELKEAGNFSKFAEAIVDDQRNDDKFKILYWDSNSNIVSIDGFTWENALAKQKTIEGKTTIVYDISL
ncbi:hypothetical protein MA9V1_053 [Chryseobacterium phage MA9V-1]|nr:hypothetical protein MA9V1_053 [Chryseobacterium phage MA9V-1]